MFYRPGLRAARFVGRLIYWLAPAQRRLALWNLVQCFPEQPLEWRRRVALGFFQQRAAAIYDLLRIASSRGQLDRRVTVENRFRVREAASQRRGVILVSAHYGNFGVLPFVFGRASPEAAFLVRRSRRRVDPVTAMCRAYYRRSLKPRSGIRIIDSSMTGGLAAARLLKAGNVVLVLADLAWGSGAVPVTFLGMPHQVSRAPAVLALRTGAVLLPVIAVRTRGGAYRVVIEHPIVPPCGERVSRVAESMMMERFAAIVEGYVKACPEQWFWLHRSWLPAADLRGAVCG